MITAVAGSDEEGEQEEGEEFQPEDEEEELIDKKEEEQFAEELETLNKGYLTCTNHHFPS